MTAKLASSQTNYPAYIGRFAPSPSGELHFGSLVTALGSFLQARSQSGEWLLRIEDIDPPREIAGASDSIMRCLEVHHLHWDRQAVFQSDRSELYDEKIQQLATSGLTYHCQCTRLQLAGIGNKQLCECATQKLSVETSAIRFKHRNFYQHFNDELLGQIDLPKQGIPQQFAIKRKDGLFAYQLAVVADDIEQGITEVARGADLLDATFYQLALYHAFNAPFPKFLHFPLVVTEPGKKLSKQNHATAINLQSVSANLIAALKFLNLLPPQELISASPEVIMSWAIQNWDLSKIPQKRERIDNRNGTPDSI